MIKLNTIEEAISDLKLGKMIIVVDDENRENEGDFVMCADHVTPEAINFMSTIGKGLICTPITSKKAKQLGLHYQVPRNTSEHQTAFTVTIDAAQGISTGISAADRSHTIKLMTKEATEPNDFVRPGHIFPLIAKDGGVLVRDGHTEASVDLARLSGASETAIICEIINEDGTMARLPELSELAQKFDLKLITIEELITYRKSHENLISTKESIPFSNDKGNFIFSVYQSEVLKEEHIALIKGDLSKGTPLIRLHSECLTGDVFGSHRCDCGAQLNKSLELLEQRENGAILYLRQEGRGIGLLNKIRAYQLQDQGHDTVEANLKLGHPADARNYDMAYQILKDLGVKQAEILTNNPDKIAKLEKLGLKELKRKALEVSPHEKNSFYLNTKKTKMGHLFEQILHH